MTIDWAARVAINWTAIVEGERSEGQGLAKGHRCRLLVAIEWRSMPSPDPQR